MKTYKVMLNVDGQGDRLYEMVMLRELIEQKKVTDALADQVRVGDHYCIDGVKYLVTLVHLGEALLTTRCGKLRIEKCSRILSQNK